MAHEKQGPHAPAAPQSGAPVQPCPTLPRLPRRGRIVPVPAWIMTDNTDSDVPVPFWPVEVHP